MNAVLELGVGTRVFYEGQAWTVAELASVGVLLTSGSGMRRTQLSHLVAHGRFLDAPADDLQQQSSAAHRVQRLDSATEKRARRIHALLVIPEESTSLADAYAATAEELGVSVRTQHRWVARYQQLGPAGLVDQRASRPPPPPAGTAGRTVAPSGASG
jgi:putative transposase